MKRLLNRDIRAFVAFVMTFVLTAASVYAFTSKKVETMTCFAEVSGEALPEGALQLKHVPLQHVSSVTKLAIVQGQAGTNPPNSAEFRGRIKPLAAGDQLVRITLRYRTENPDGGFSAVTEQTETGFDPVAFAFQIDPKDISSGNIQYQLFAARVKLELGVEVLVGTVSVPSDAVINADSWITVGVTANAAQVFSVSGGRIMIPDGNPNDGESYVDIPANLFLLPTQVTFSEVPLGSSFNSFSAAPAPPAGPLALYEFNADQPFKGALVASLLYPDFEFPIGQDGILDGTSYPESAASVVWWDGSTWRRMNSQRNANLNTLTFRFTSAMHFFAIVPAGASSPEASRTLDKVITPNGDTINDNVIFSFFDQTSDIQVEIFDVQGHRVRALSSNGGMAAWDGRNDSGDIVESGVYIYQYTDGGKRLSGVVAVAK